MTDVRRLTVLRAAALVGLAASAALTADALGPGRRFCPVEEACAAARESPLGHVLGVPMSLIGIVAFAGLFAAALVPASGRSRRLVRLAGVVAPIVGAALLAYQAFALGALCPLCLFADVAALAVGAATGFGTRVPSGRAAPGPPHLRFERGVTWASAGILALLGPLLVAGATSRSSTGWVPLASADAAERATRDASAGIPLVEYLNPFCVHCRATHARLARVLEERRVPVDRERVYVWSSAEPPLWAKACACALESGGDERRLFRELLSARDESGPEVWGAARRAGLDAEALRAYVERGGATERLAKIHARVLAAHLAGLPTIDVGRRRLRGEQTEDELRDALSAALREGGTALVR